MIIVCQVFYFVTICINQRICLLSEIIDNKVVLSDVGMMVERNYLGLEKRFTNIRCDRYVIMPNHVHCIFEIKNCDDTVGVVPCANPISRQPQGIAATNKTPDQKNASLDDVIGVFKSISTVEYIRNVSKIIGKNLIRNFGNETIMSMLLEAKSHMLKLQNILKIIQLIGQLMN